MDISQYALLLLHVYAVLLGGGLGVLYDCFRVTRVFFGAHYSRKMTKRIQEIRLPLLKPVVLNKKAPFLDVAVFLGDLLFCLIAAVSVILLCYGMNDGGVRLLALFCCGAGFVLYRMTLCRVMLPLLEWGAFAFSCVVRYGCFFLAYPIRRLGQACRRILHRLGKTCANWVQKQERRVYTDRVKRMASLDACGIIPEKGWNHIHRKGEKNGKRKKKAIQPQLVDPYTAGRHRSGFHRYICK